MSHPRIRWIPARNETDRKRGSSARNCRGKSSVKVKDDQHENHDDVLVVYYPHVVEFERT